MDFDHRDSQHTVPTLRLIYQSFHRHPTIRSDMLGGFWIIGGYDDIKTTELDWRTFSSAEGNGLDIPEGMAIVPALWQDPPEQTIWRRIYADWINQRDIDRRRPMIRELTDHHVGRFADAGGGDFVHDVSEALPVEIIAHTLGLGSVATDIRRLTAIWVATTDMTARGQLLELLLREIRCRRATPQMDFLSTLLDTRIDDRGITDDEALRWLIGGVIAGHETTLMSGAGLAYELARDGALRARLRTEPDLIPVAVQEALRLHPPVQCFFRTVTEDTEIDEVVLRRGDKVMLSFAAGNLDERRFPEPLQFRLDRSPNRHLSFGWGVHRCVGAPLAQLELETLAETLLRYDFELSGDVVFGPPTSRGNFAGIDRLPIAVRAVAQL